MTLSGAASATTTASASGNLHLQQPDQRRLHGDAQQVGIHLHSGEPGGYGEQRQRRQRQLQHGYLQHLRHDQRHRRQRRHRDPERRGDRDHHRQRHRNLHLQQPDQRRYTVTPSKTGFTFTPASPPSPSTTPTLRRNFSTVTYTISGTISGTGGNAATVTLSGAASATTTASATGTYTFSNLTNGSYTVTPSKSGFTFTPASKAVTVNNASVANVNFATVTTFSISGTISGTGGNAATVTLSGAKSATTTASATGTFTFTGLTNGSYTVTPSKTGYIFTPVNRAVTVNDANVTGVNYTSTAQLAIDKTASTDSTGVLTSVTSAAFTTTKTNELLVAMISANGLTSGTTVSSVTGGGLTWTLVRRTNTQRGTAEIWRAFSASIVTNATVRANFSMSTAASITVVTFSGVDTTGTGGSGAIGGTGSASGTTGAQSASLTTTRNNSWVLGVGTDSQGGSSRTMGSNQTMIHQDTNTFTGWVQRQNSTTPTSGTAVAINDTAPTNHRYDLTICEVLPAQ